jgi:pimeloyl-ACP methyl ester carboxylesterase
VLRLPCQHLARPPPPTRRCTLRRLAVKSLRWGAASLLDVLLPLLEEGPADRLASVSAPVLVLQGGADAWHPPGNAARLASRLAGAPSVRAEVLQGAGHWLSQEPDAGLGAVAGELVRWMEGAAGPGPS